MQGASGVLFNVTGGKDLTLAQVHDVADIIRETARPDANIIFGVVQDKRMKKRVSITLVATGVESARSYDVESTMDATEDDLGAASVEELLDSALINGHATAAVGETRKLI